MNKNNSAVIVVNKEKGMTSFDVVHQISKMLGTKKVGHTGTLDPLAEGVLVICIGQATKIVELLTAQDKEYIASVKLGIETDTLDMEGTIIRKEVVPEKLDVEKAVQSFDQKSYDQEVPIYSAVKVAGKKLYEYARNNEKVELPKKKVTIKHIELLEKTKDTFQFRCEVTKGCYIRSLIRDIGEVLKTPTTMTSLIRTRQGKISIEEAYTIKEMEEGKAKFYSIEDILPYPIIQIDSELEKKVSNGVKIEDQWQIQDKVLFKNKNNQLLGIYEKKDNLLVTWKNFSR